MRIHHESIVKLKGMTPDNKIPIGLLLDKNKFNTGFIIHTLFLPF